MGDFTKQIEEITGMAESEFTTLWKRREKEWNSGMDHVTKHFQKCMRMLNGEEQWDPDLAAKRKDDKRPTLIENLLPDFVNKPHGEFCMTTPQADVDPVDSDGDPKVAEIIKGIIYNIAYQFSGTAIHQDAYYNLIGGGLTGWCVGTRYAGSRTFDVEPTIRQVVNISNLRWDLSAIEPDLSDKKFAWVLETMEEDEFKKQYGKDKWKPAEWDKPTGSGRDLWYTNKKVTLAQVYWIQETPFTLYEHPDGSLSEEKPSVDVKEDGTPLRTRESADKVIWTCIISPTEVISEPIQWPDYTDDPIIPVIIVPGRKIIVDGKINYKGLISNGLDIQQLHNYWITAITEALALQPDAPYMATDAQVSGFDEWTDLSKKVRVLRYKHDPKAGSTMPQRQAPPQLSSAMMAMPQYTRQSLRDIIGLQQASLGIASNEKSGIAIQKRKQEGDAGKFSFNNNMNRGIELEAKILVNILPVLIDTPRAIRITGPSGVKSIAYIKMQNPDAPSEPVLNLSVGKYDVRISTGTPFNTQRDEARAMLSDLIQYLGPIAPQAVTAITPMFIKFVNVPGADEMARIIIATLPPQLQAFYQDKEGKESIPPELIAQMKEIAAQLEQAKALAQQQNVIIEDLKKDRDLKLREIEGKEGLEREKLAKEITIKEEELRVKEKEIETKREMKLEEISAMLEVKMREILLKTRKGIADEKASDQTA